MTVRRKEGSHHRGSTVPQQSQRRSTLGWTTGCDCCSSAAASLSSPVCPYCRLAAASALFHVSIEKKKKFTAAAAAVAVCSGTLPLSSFAVVSAVGRRALGVVGVWLPLAHSASTVSVLMAFKEGEAQSVCSWWWWC